MNKPRSSIDDLAAEISRANPRVSVATVEPLSLAALTAFELRLEFSYRSPRGTHLQGVGRAYIALGEHDGAARPLVYHAGYEVPPEVTVGYLGAGAVVVTPCSPGDPTDLSNNPLTRGINLDVALLHIARALPCVDLGRVLIAGGSAGGYMAMMLAAESFPLMGVIASCPVVNLAYNLKYLGANLALTTADPAALPVLSAVAGLAPAASAVYGVPPDPVLLMAHSPLTHLDEITAPIQVLHSTADLLVPIDQLSGELAQRRDASAFPKGFVLSPGELGMETMPALLDLLPAGSLHLLSLPDGAPRMPAEFPYPPISGPVPPVPVPWPAQGWAVAILDEGPPEPGVGHMKFITDLQQDLPAIMSPLASGNLAQLTPAKLQLLMKRLSGEPWIDGPLSSMDSPEAEARDVNAALAWWQREPARKDHLAALKGQAAQAGRRAPQRR